MIKCFLEWGNQDISFGNFIGVALVIALITIAACLTVLIFLDVLIGSNEMDQFFSLMLKNSMI